MNKNFASGNSMVSVVEIIYFFYYFYITSTYIIPRLHYNTSSFKVKQKKKKHNYKYIT